MWVGFHDGGGGLWVFLFCIFPSSFIVPHLEPLKCKSCLFWTDPFFIHLAVNIPLSCLDSLRVRVTTRFRLLLQLYISPLLRSISLVQNSVSAAGIVAVSLVLTQFPARFPNCVNLRRNKNMEIWTISTAYRLYEILCDKQALSFILHIVHE